MGLTEFGPGNLPRRSGIDNVIVPDVPTTGQVLVATSATTAEWEDASGGGGGGGVQTIDGNPPDEAGDVDLSGTYAPIPGTPVVRAFPFAFDSPNILTGYAVYTPTVGDVLLDAWMEITEAWDGTTPKGDVGPLLESRPYGWWGDSGGWTIDMTLPDGSGAPQGLSWNTSYQNGNGNFPLTAFALGFSGATFSGYGRPVPASFNEVDPIKVVVSQDGSIFGEDPVSTQGSAILYLVTATPA